MTRYYKHNQIDNNGNLKSIRDICRSKEEEKFNKEFARKECERLAMKYLEPWGQKIDEFKAQNIQIPTVSVMDILEALENATRNYSRTIKEYGYDKYLSGFEIRLTFNNALKKIKKNHWF